MTPRHHEEQGRMSRRQSEREWMKEKEGSIFQACVDAGEPVTLLENEWEPNEERGISYFSPS